MSKKIVQLCVVAVVIFLYAYRLEPAKAQTQPKEVDFNGSTVFDGEDVQTDIDLVCKVLCLYKARYQLQNMDSEGEIWKAAKPGVIHLHQLYWLGVEKLPFLSPTNPASPQEGVILVGISKGAQGKTLIITYETGNVYIFRIPALSSEFTMAFYKIKEAKFLTFATPTPQPLSSKVRVYDIDIVEYTGSNPAVLPNNTLVVCITICTNAYLKKDSSTPGETKWEPYMDLHIIASPDNIVYQIIPGGYVGGLCDAESYITKNYAQDKDSYGVIRRVLFETDKSISLPRVITETSWEDIRKYFIDGGEPSLLSTLSDLDIQQQPSDFLEDIPTCPS